MLTTVLALSVLGAAGTPTDVVKAANTEVQKVLASKDASVEKLAQTADTYVDFLELAKRALGKEWDKLDKKQQDDFSTTMRGLLRASYAQKALGQGNAQMKYGAEKVNGAEADVNTTILVNKDEFPIVYKLYKGPKAWRIYDVITDDVSLVTTYRDQFRKLIAEKGYDGLITALKSKKAQLEKSAASAGAPAASN